MSVEDCVPDLDVIKTIDVVERSNEHLVQLSNSMNIDECVNLHCTPTVEKQECDVSELEFNTALKQVLSQKVFDADVNVRQKEVISETINKKLTDTFDEEPCTFESLSQNVEEQFLTSETCLDHFEDVDDVKPILTDFTVDNISECSDIPVKIEHYIKSECRDETVHTNTLETVIKTELETDFELYEHDIPENILVDDDSGNSTDLVEKYLNINSDQFTKFCGLPNYQLFSALLEYISDDMEVLEGVSKYQQLFSILTKLHTNEGYLYLNKYVFPVVYVSMVELLFKRLVVLCKELPDVQSVPRILMSEFSAEDKVVILSIRAVHIQSEFKNFPLVLKTVKYLIGYTAFGEVFFVSRGFIGSIGIQDLIIKSGVLTKLKSNYWIVLNIGDGIFTGTVSQLKKCDTDNFDRLNSFKAKHHTFNVIGRLFEHFKVLVGIIPDFMLSSELGNTSFLDKLVFVCCMLLNMLPLCTYR